MSSALKSWYRHDELLSCSQQDYNDPEIKDISRYYFPGKIHDIVSIITKKNVSVSEPFSDESVSFQCSGFCWEHHHGIFTGVDFTFFNLYYYSNC